MIKTDNFVDALTFCTGRNPVSGEEKYTNNRPTLRIIIPVILKVVADHTSEWKNSGTVSTAVVGSASERLMLVEAL